MVTLMALFLLQKCFTSSPKETVLKHGLLQLFLGFKFGLIKNFWTFKLSFDIVFGVFLRANVWAIFEKKIGQFFKTSNAIKNKK